MKVAWFKRPALAAAGSPIFHSRMNGLIPFGNDIREAVTRPGELQ
jgi:hypothetical protein